MNDLGACVDLVQFCSFFWIRSLDQIRACRERFLGLDLDSDGVTVLRSAHFTICATCTAHFRVGGAQPSPTRLGCCSALKLRRCAFTELHRACTNRRLFR